jgi:hypothetical protein
LVAGPEDGLQGDVGVDDFHFYVSDRLFAKGALIFVRLKSEGGTREGTREGGGTSEERVRDERG